MRAVQMRKQGAELDVEDVEQLVGALLPQEILL